MTLSKSETRLINLLFLTSVLIFINLGPVSISFPVGVFVILYFSRRINFKLFKNPVVWLTLIFVTGVLSSILSEIPFTSNIYFLIQFFYWLLLAALTGRLYPYLEKKSLAKTVAIGSLVCGGVFLAFRLGSQNSVAFILVIISPLGVYGFEKKANKLLYAILVLVFMFFNESRTGLAILSVEFMFVFARLFEIRNLRTITIGAILAVVLLLATPLHVILGRAIEPYNTEMGMLLADADAVFYSDKSWITRRIQVEKGLQLFNEHPVLGVGPGNFSKIYIDIDVSNINNVDDAALSASLKSSDYRSTHNSYITLLSEFGIVGTLLWAFFIIAYLITAIRHSKRFEDFEFLLFVCVVGMSVYFYTIAAFYGTVAWLFYGLMYGYTDMYKRKNKR